MQVTATVGILCKYESLFIFEDEAKGMKLVRWEGESQNKEDLVIFTVFGFALLSTELPL